ncbi:MAG: 3-deoxy-D-manno-octulosonic acid transferase [Roseovarius sp.]
MQGAPLPVRLYRVAANIVAPLAYRRVAAKLDAQGISPTRQKERLGRATAARPKGRLIWFHAASVGESLSVLRLIEHLGHALPDASFLLTSGTATSAQIVAKRLPPRTQHQFAPLDAARPLRRFLRNWHPDAAIFVESELWPQMLSHTHDAGIPLALINARISDGSARNWKRFPQTARHLMNHFRLIHCQDARTARHLHDLGLPQAETGQNLKSLAGPLPYDAKALADLQETIGPRPLWLASSTHPGEDEIMLAAHASVLAKHPDALLILVPRHPERADAIAKLITDAGLTPARRSTGEHPTDGTQVYLADTLGETGLWYALSPLTCLCGSFTPVGGHNPYEPAHAGSAILHGPLYANFAKTYPELDASGAALEVEDADALATQLDHLLTTRDQLETMRQNARRFAASQTDMLDAFAETLCKALALR